MYSPEGRQVGCMTKVRAISQFSRERLAVGIHKRDAINMLIAVYIGDPPSVGRDCGRGIIAECRRYRPWGAARERLTVEPAVSSKEDFARAECEGAAAVTNAPRHIEPPIRKIAGCLATGLRQQYTCLATAFPPNKGVANVIPLNIAQIDATGDRRAVYWAIPGTKWFAHAAGLTLI